MGKAVVKIIDMKRLEFAYLRGTVEVAATEEAAEKMLVWLCKEMNRRLLILEKAGVVKIQDYKGDDLPFIVCIIDEIAELQSDNSAYLLNKLLRLSAASGITIVAATQRPSVEVIKGDSRGQLLARISYKMASEIDSRMVLGDNCSRAAYLPNIRGRAIFKYDKIREVQTMFLPVEEAKQRLETHCAQPA